MTASNKNQNEIDTTSNKTPIEQDVDVLYQKLGDRWFAFSIINDEVFMSPVSEDQINTMRNEETLDQTVSESMNFSNTNTPNNDSNNEAA